ncbi:MAG: hypothetical protein ACP5R4_08340 [Armatimonadota bacterium]
MFAKRLAFTAAAAVLTAAIAWSAQAPAQKTPQKAPEKTEKIQPAVPKAKETASKTQTGASAKPAAATPAPAKPAQKPAQAKVLSPEEVVRQYLQYRDRKEDDKSYALLSDSSKKRWTAEEWRSQARNVRATFGAVLAVAGEALLIGGESVADSRVEKVTVKGDQATVKVRQYVPIPTDIVLVKEKGQWRIDLTKTMGAPESAKAEEKPKTESKPAAQETKPATPQPTQPDTTPLCKANARQIAVAFQLYALNNDGRLPEASNWTDAIRPYLTNPSVLKCPADTEAGHEVSFAMNEKLSGAVMKDIKNGFKTVLLYETTTGKPNQAGTGETIPSPPRHKDGNVYIMADGTVETFSEKPAF